jgi:hypothetical protein
VEESILMNARKLRRGLLLFVGIAAAVTAPPAWPDDEDAGTLEIDAVFQAPFKEASCPPGTPDTTHCFPATAEALIRGLGKTSMQFLIVEDRSQLNPDCAHARISSLPILVPGKGEIDLSAKSSGCQPSPIPKRWRTP